MSAPMQAALPKLKLYALVRDQHGRPKVDDPQNLPPEIKAALTADDLAFLGLEEAH